MSPSAAFAEREGAAEAKGKTNADAAIALPMMADLSLFSWITLSLFFQIICL